MSNKLPWVLVMLLAGFCVFFIAGYFRAQHELSEMNSFDGRARLLADHLKLDTEQMNAYSAALATLKSERDKLLKSTAADSDAFWAEAVKDSPDRAKLEESVSRSVHFHTTIQNQKLEFVLDFFKHLTPKQREEFARYSRMQNRNNQ